MKVILGYTFVTLALIALVCCGRLVWRFIRSFGYWIVDSFVNVRQWIKDHRAYCWACDETTWSWNMYKQTGRCKSCVKGRAFPSVERFDKPRPMIPPPPRARLVPTEKPKYIPVVERVPHKPAIAVEPPVVAFDAPPAFRPVKKVGIV